MKKLLFIFAVLATALSTSAISPQSEDSGDEVFCEYIDGSHNVPASDKGVIECAAFKTGLNGDFTNSVRNGYLKVRTGNDDKIVFQVNEGYFITGIMLYGYSNNASSSADRSIYLSGVYVDGSSYSKIAEPVKFNGGTAGQSISSALANGFMAKDSVVLTFDNSRIDPNDSEGKNKQLMAKFKIDYMKYDGVTRYSLTYMVDDKVYSIKYYKEGETVVPLEEPEKEGYKFSGWTGLPETMPAEDVVVTGSFSICSYDLIYNVLDEEFKRQTYKYGETIVPIEDVPVVDGYSFNGWKNIPQTMPDKDVIVNAQMVKSGSENLILYTSSDGQLVNPKHLDVFGANIVSNTYDCFGIIEFDGPVTSIGYEAFDGSWNLTSVEIPNSVTSIGEEAFNNCSSLSSSVTSIDKYAFYNCSSLSTVEIPNSVTSIGKEAFYNCSSLSTVEIPNSVTSIGEEAFYKCPVSKYICDNERYLKLFSGEYDWVGNWYPNKNLQEVVIGNSVTSIGNSAFKDCSSLVTINIPESVTEVGDYAFAGCTSLPVIDDIRYADTYLVGAVEKSRRYDIKEGTRFIGSEAFKDYVLFSSIEIPSTVVSIGASAFQGCTALKSLEIPSTLKKIYRHAFMGCTALETVQYNAVDCDCSDVYNSENTKLYPIFISCSNLTKIIIGDGVKIIPDYSFAYTSNLKEVDIPSTVTRIGKYAFTAAIIESVVIPDAVTEIDANAFWKCAELKEVVIPNNVVILSNSAFNSCSKLESVVLSKSLETIGNKCFYKCSMLTEIEIPSSVTSIGEEAFTYTNLTTATYACSGEAAKNVNPASLKEITLTAEVENFENYPFNSLSKLEKLNCYAENPPALTSTQFTDAQFDNLEVHVPTESIKAYEKAPVWKLFFKLTGDLVDGIEGVTVDSPLNKSAKAYNLQGVEVGEGYKGIVIQNGKKMLRK